MTDEGKGKEISPGTTQITATGAGATKQVSGSKEKGEDAVGFTQEQVNGFIAEERRKWTEKSTKESDEKQRELEKKGLEEKQKYKELYEAEEKEKESLKALLESEKIKLMRAKIAAEVGLPSELTDRLIGQTEEDVKKDAEKLMAVVKRVPDDGEYVGTPGGEGKSKPTGTGAKEEKKKVDEITQKIVNRFGYNDAL